MEPIIKTLEQEKYKIIKIDGGSQNDLCKELKIAGFPTFLVYKNGKLTQTKEGILDLQTLKNLYK